MAERPNPIQIQQFLEGVDYPADRAALVAAAEEQGADADALAALRAIPEGTYSKPTDVSSAVADADRQGGDQPADDEDERSGERFDAG
ncbi:DUF2795 domain-containing protein [Sinomonas halotolerans]|uniref:DUF2795 domain-containing protein n=1 Tax=Sinomonas halotolerans TaxID=1644133 RepID=A0ABU9WV46_9MICC